MADIEEKWPAVPYQPKPVETYQVAGKGANTEPNLSADGAAGYGHALAWCITSKQVYAANVAKICRAWAVTNKRFVQSDPALHAGLWTGALIDGAEIVKGLGAAPWDAAVDAEFKQWIEAVIVPLLETQLQVSNNHGNWSSLARRTALAYAVFNNDRYQFNRLIELHKMHLAADVASAPWGEVNETCRTWPPHKAQGGKVYFIDTAHLQMGGAGFIGAAVTAWNQGVDLYGWAEPGATAYCDSVSYTDADFHGSRLANIVEYTAAILQQGNAVKPFPRNIYPHPSWPGNYLNADGTLYAGAQTLVTPWGWEMVYHHYKGEKGLTLPCLEQMIARTRAAGKKWDGYVHSIGLGTLTHALPTALAGQKWNINRQLVIGYSHPPGSARLSLYGHGSQKGTGSPGGGRDWFGEKFGKKFGENRRPHS